MAQRDAGEADLHLGAGATDQERRLARIVAGGPADLRRQRGDLVEQHVELARGVGTVERGDELDRLLQALEIGAELVLQVLVEHGESSGGGMR